ncbi:MAG: valine--tRNA ligase [Chloroflexota bacterium]
MITTHSSPREPLSKAYEAAAVEERLYRWWEESGFFKAQVNPAKKPFTIIMPPPNVTGQLHLGHAMTAAIEDALTRYHRMKGFEALWLPGTDHAGIATQMVVERELAKQGSSRHAIGREAFVKRVWEWVGTYGGIIEDQLRRLGASCDWSRKTFTLDEGPSLAVRTTFKNLYERGLIYRGERITNWCVTCRTALSDLEVDHAEEPGALYQIRYEFADGPLPDGRTGLVVATTRPETLFGDTAVAVHPDDPRYEGLVGKRVVLPVTGKHIPVIADEAVALDFGTGALKITPGHDPNDFETGERHHLPIVNVLNPDGSLNEVAGPFAGQERLAARKALVARLEADGLLEGVTEHPHSVGHCQRSGDIVEPIVSAQWFVAIKPLAERALEAVRDGRTRIVPERFEKVYANWMENIRDWCISRQLWWGHRIPVWYCADCAHVTVSIEDPAACEGCGSAYITQDEDVLDTWFSSGLWPHSTLGWPQKTADLDYFYPSTVMETGYDILFFWVARMMMMGLENVDDVPFQTVYLHGLVRDADGAKMSKTKGNVIDPLESIAEYGADALRFALTTGTTPGNDTRLSPARLQAARNFTNKLWNMGRFVLAALDEADDLSGWEGPGLDRTHPEDRWVLAKAQATAVAVNAAFTELQLAEAQRVLYEYLWSTVADWYIELAKVRMRAGDQRPRKVLAHVLERCLRLLHPFMPYVTEELWQHLKDRLPDPGDTPVSLMLASMPDPVGRLGQEAVDARLTGEAPAVEAMETVLDVVRSVRNVRAEFKIDPATPLDAVLTVSGDEGVLRAEAEAIRALARVGTLSFASDGAQAPAGAVKLVVRNVAVMLDVGAGVDLAAERARLGAEATETERYLRGLAGRLSNEQFVEKAPAEVVERERARLEDGQARLERIRQLLTELG